MFHRIHRRFEKFARIEFGLVFIGNLANNTQHRQTTICVDIDLAHTVFDAAFNLFKRHTPGLRHLATMRVKYILQFLRHARRAMHHKMNIRQAVIDFFNHIHCQNFTIRLAGKFIGPMAGAHGNGKRIDLRLFDKIHRLIRVGQQLVFR